MLYNPWDLGKTRSHAKGKTAAWIYLYEIFEENDEKEILEFIKRCILDITGRTVNMAISDNYVINFIHYPYERESSYATYTFWTNDEPIKTNKEIMQFIDQYSANR